MSTDKPTVSPTGLEQTETLDKLYLEWSQFTSARTHREIALSGMLREVVKKMPPDSDITKLADEVWAANR